MVFTRDQREAIEDLDNNLLVIAGPGSGKTSVILAKVSYLLDHNYKAEDIIVTTYTNKAKEELKDRLSFFCERPPHNITICTIHGLCRLIIKEFAYNLTTQILYLMDELDQRFFIINNYKDLGIREESFGDKDNMFAHIFSLFSFFDSLSEHTVSLDKMKAFILRQRPNSSYLNSLRDKGVLLSDRDILGILDSYRKFMWDDRSLDFSQTLKFTYNLLKSADKIKKILRGRYKYILVDEYQDVSYLQHEIYKLLVSEENNICAVGDDDQGLYEFRGASVYNIRYFKEDFPNVRVLKIGDNFRSTANIVSFSNSIIKRISRRSKKDLVSQKGDRANIILIEAERTEDLAKSIANVIKKMSAKNLVFSYSEIALLFYSVRWQFIGEGYKDIFEKEKIPFKINKSGNFFEEKPVSIFMDILSLILKRDFFFTDFINVLENLALADITPILDKIAKDRKVSFIEIEPERLKTYYSISSSKDMAKLKQLYCFYEKLVSGAISDLIEFIYDLFSLTPHLTEAIVNKDSYILLQLGYFSQLGEYHKRWGKGSALTFIDSLLVLKKRRRIDARSQRDIDAVNIMTIHSSKGLEYKSVFICDFRLDTNKQSGFNIPKSLLNKRDKDTNVIEQRTRLLYTALTRSKDYLFLAYPRINKYGRTNKRHFFIESALKEHKISPPDIEKLELISYDSNDKPSENNKPRESITLSFSKIESYLLCPLSYELEYVYGFRSLKSFKVSFGNLVHGVLEQIHFMTLHKEVVSKDIIKEILLKQIKKLNLTDKKEIELYEKDAKELLFSYFTSYYPKFAPYIKAVEKDFEIYVKLDRLAVKVDLILGEDDGSMSVIDFKTGGKDNLSTERQLLTYAYALRLVGYNISRLSAYYLRDNELVSYELDEDRLDLVEKEIGGVFDLISKKEFSAKPDTKSCLLCGLNKICPYDANK